MGITQHDKIYRVDELAQGNVMFAATGVTDGSYLRGVHFFGGGATTESVVISATHSFDRKPNFTWLTSKL